MVHDVGRPFEARRTRRRRRAVGERPRKAGKPSDPYLLAGYAERVVHLANGSDHPVNFTLEVDRHGKGQWAKYTTIAVPAHGYVFDHFTTMTKDDWVLVNQSEWVRVTSDADCDDATAWFHYGSGGGAEADSLWFKALPETTDESFTSVTVRPRAEDPGTLWFEALAEPQRPLPADGLRSHLGLEGSSV